MTIALQALGVGILAGGAQLLAYIGLNIWAGEKWNQGV